MSNGARNSLMIIWDSFVLSKTPQYTLLQSPQGGWCSAECTAVSGGRVCALIRMRRLRLLWLNERQTCDAGHEAEAVRCAARDRECRHRASVQFGSRSD